MYSNPKVSCLCPTYGRPRLLGEAIRCFLDQDYPNKEMIVLNDQEGVSLILPSCPDNVKIINYPTRFRSLGEKRNYLKSLGTGDLFCIWDDDDLYTPFRISDSVKLMRECSGYDIIKAQDAYMSTDDQGYMIANNLFHSQACITKEYMDETMYPNISVGEDSVFERGANIYSANLFPMFWYIYRWGAEYSSSKRDSK